MANQHDINEVIGTKIKYLRESKNMSQNALGSLLNVTRSQISKFESGTREVNPYILCVLSTEFKVNIDYFFDNSLPMENIQIIKNILEEKYNREVSIAEVLNECTQYGYNEILKQEELCNLTSLNYHDLEELKRTINFPLSNFKITGNKSDLIAAIKRQFEIWGVYNSIKLSDDENKLINTFIDFIEYLWLKKKS